MTKVIGLTGGIGSGKTTVAKYIASKGIPVYIADDAARMLMNSTEIQEQIVALLGDSVCNDNLLDRKKIAAVVFQNPEKLKQLNQIIHPAVQAHFKNWLLENATAHFVVKEAAILFESGSYKDCYKIITVIAPEDLRIARIKSRDKVTDAEIKVRMQNQWTDEQRLEKSDFVIENNNLSELYKKTDEILNLLHNS